MQIKALQAFSYREADGDIFSVALDEIVEMDSTLANGFIADGLAEEYSGGGSSDFSTAEVTVNVPPQSGVLHGFRIYGAFIDSYESEDYSIGSIRISSQGTRTITLLLYKGVAYMYFDDGITPTTEGLITYDDGMYKVTGDCTITIS